MKTKISLSIITLSLFIFVAFRIYYFLTDDFHVSNISYSMPPNAAWDFPITETDKNQLQEILNQKFYYIGKGAQVYAFASADHKYVLKFFKFKHLKPSVFISFLPGIGPLQSIKEANHKRKMRKLLGVFEGHAIAFKHDKEHSGLLYLHLNPTHNLQLKAHLVDKMGFDKEIDLDPIVFIVQKRGETFRTTLTHLLEKKDIQTAIQRGKQILDMYVDEYQEGVWDRDHGVSHNTGFIGNQPFHLDVGKFSYNAKMEKLFIEQDLKHVAYKMEEWVQKNYPDFYSEFTKALEDYSDRLLHQFNLSQPMPTLSLQTHR